MKINLFCHQIREPSGVVNRAHFIPQPPTATVALLSGQNSAFSITSQPASQPLDKSEASGKSLPRKASARRTSQYRVLQRNLLIQRQRQRHRTNHNLSTARVHIGAMYETNRVSNAEWSNKRAADNCSPSPLPSWLPQPPHVQRRTAHLRTLESILYRSFFSNPVGRSSMYCHVCRLCTYFGRCCCAEMEPPPRPPDRVRVGRHPG